MVVDVVAGGYNTVQNVLMANFFYERRLEGIMVVIILGWMVIFMINTTIP